MMELFSENIEQLKVVKLFLQESFITDVWRSPECVSLLPMFHLRSEKYIHNLNRTKKKEKNTT